MQALFQLATSQPASLVLPTQDITKLYSQYTGAASHDHNLVIKARVHGDIVVRIAVFRSQPQLV
jgi:hypothetical protein